jgi:hypothetical protein
MVFFAFKVYQVRVDFCVLKPLMFKQMFNMQNVLSLVVFRLEKLTRSINICRFIIQTEVYLFWSENAKLISLLISASVTIRVKPGFIEVDNSAFRLV